MVSVLNKYFYLANRIILKHYKHVNILKYLYVKMSIIIDSTNDQCYMPLLNFCWQLSDILLMYSYKEQI